MLQKESKIRILENFYALDYVFFGKKVQEMQSCCEALTEEYTTIKGALMSVMVEMHKAIEHAPEVIEEKLSKKDLRALAVENAKIARQNAQKLVETDAGKADIKAELSEALEENADIDISSEVQSKIREKAFSLAVDNILIARALNESKNIEKLNDWEGKIVEDAYKELRDQLVETAMYILEADELTN